MQTTGIDKIIGLKGVQTEYYTLFSNQEHSIPSCVDHISDLKVHIDAVIISYEVCLLTDLNTTAKF